MQLCNLQSLHTEYIRVQTGSMVIGRKKSLLLMDAHTSYGPRTQNKHKKISICSVDSNSDQNLTSFVYYLKSRLL